MNRSAETDKHKTEAARHTKTKIGLWENQSKWKVTLVGNIKGKNSSHLLYYLPSVYWFPSASTLLSLVSFAFIHSLELLD